jgi:hypothetical protein
MCQILCVNAGIHGVGLYGQDIRIVELLFQHMQKIEPYRVPGVNRRPGFAADSDDRHGNGQVHPGSGVSLSEIAAKTAGLSRE